MRVPLLALTLPLVLAALTAHPDPAQAPFASLPTAKHPASQTPERFDGQTVQRFSLVGLPRERRDDLVRVLNSFNLDIWRIGNKTLDVRVPSALWKAVLSALPGDWDVSTMISDLQELVEEARPAQSLSNSFAHGRSSDAFDSPWDMSDLGTPFHDQYHSFDDMLLFGNALVNAFPDLVTQTDLGVTHEGRPIRAWSIRAGLDEGEDELPRYEFVVQSGQHAREWVGPASAFYLLHAIALDARSDPKGKWKELLRSYTFTVVPIINPDGYVYSQVSSRMWKKNRQDVGGLVCKGIDLNTNWGYQFAPSRLVCSDGYSGQYAFEANETRIMGNYLQNGTADGERELPIKAFVDVHSYGQLFMFPFAYSCEDFPADAENLMEAGLGAAKAMRMREGEAYQTGQACDLTYRAAGDAMDFAYATAEVRWSYSLEMRDTGTYGFLLPPRLIRPTAEELASGMKALARFIFDTEIDP